MIITGRAVLLLAFGLLPVALVPSTATVLAWIALTIVVVLIDLLLAAPPGSVAVQREPIASLRLDGPTASAVLVSNTGTRRLRGSLRDAWQPSAGALANRHPIDIPAGQRRRVSTGLIPTRRGDLKAPFVVLRSLGPMGLAARQHTLPAPGSVRVLPPFHSRRHLPSRLARLRELDGRTAINVRGQGTEFDSLRDYVVGDDVRAIDWRATARRQQVVVRTWRPERERRVLLVLDTSRTSAARIGDVPRLDAEMDAALLLGALATRAGDRVDMIAMDRRPRAQVLGHTGADLLAAMVDAMAPLEPDLVEADWVAIGSTVRERLSQRALVVLLTSLEPAAMDEGLLDVLPVLTSRHLVVIAAVEDPGLNEMAADRSDVRSIYDAAAAERATIDREVLVAELHRYGVEVVSGEPDQLPPRLADRYLALKAAGRL